MAGGARNNSIAITATGRIHEGRKQIKVLRTNPEYNEMFQSSSGIN